MIDVPGQFVGAAVASHAVLFALAEFDGADGGEILRVVGSADEAFGRYGVGQREIALLPDFGDVIPPALLHALDVSVGATEQQHHRAQCVAACKYGQVLHDDGFEERSHQFIGRHAGLLQTVDIGFGEDATLAGHRVKAYAGVAHLAKLVGGNPELGVDLIDDRAGAAGALVVHRGKFLLAARLGIFFEDDDLGILAAELDDRATLGVHLLHGERNGVDFLYELGAEILRKTVAARTGDEDAASFRVESVHLVLHAPQQFQDPLRLLGVVPLIVLEQDLVGYGVDQHRFDGGRANIHADQQVSSHLSGVLRALGAQATAVSDMAVRWRRHPSARMRSPTCSRKLAAVPTTPFTCGTRYMGRLSSGCAST